MNQVFTFLFLLGSCALFAQDFSKVEIVPEKVTDQIYVLRGAGGNIGVFTGDDGLFMIDDQFAPLGDKIKAALNDLAGTGPKYLINTHWHGDHTGGNEYFGKTGAILIAHDNVRQRMSTGLLMEAFNRKVDPSPPGALPVITFSDDLKMHLNGEEILAFHVHNAHTDGDAIIYFPKNNVIHMGDTYFQTGYPYIDLASGGTVDGLIKTINRVLFLVDDDTQIIPGHGKLSNRTELITYRDMLQTLRNRVKKAIAAGMTLEEIIAANLSKDYDERWGGAYIKPEKIIDTFYTDFSR